MTNVFRYPTSITAYNLNDRATKRSGVAIYRKQNNSHVVTPHMDIIYCQTSGLVIATQDIGDICAAECIFENGLTVISVAVYISPNQAV
ncbi:hypothetical protein TNCV_431421 [Trichonephila clavipes]|nr:hypothetical protein TNCV_431421 [Trichonephila clavipes]